MKKQSSVFLSYSSKDKQFANRLAVDLQLAGVRVWIDEGEIKLGDSLIEKIRNGIDEVDYLSVVLSPTSVASEWVKREVDIAMNQEIEGRKVKVLPLLYQKCDLPWFLKGKRYADFTDEGIYNDSFAEILRRLGIAENDTVLAFDIGGGTTDVITMKIRDEYIGKVDVEAIRSDLQSISLKHKKS